MVDVNIVRLGILTVLAGLSGLFAAGFVIFAIYSVVVWRLKKAKLYQLWGALIGGAINTVIFLLTFPIAYPELREIIDRAIRRFL